MRCAERVAESPEEGVDVEGPGAVSPVWAQGREEARAGGRAQLVRTVGERGGGQGRTRW